MTGFDTGRIYFDLQITAESPTTEIWLGDDEGHLVVKEVGELHERLMAGDYIVEFGLGTTCYPIRLREDAEYTQHDLQAGPACERPVPQIPDEA
jgi:hypothetical protein